MKSPKEGDVVKACLQYLTVVRRWPALRNNTGAARFAGRGKSYFVRFGLEGSSDIIGIVPRLVDGDGNELRGLFLAVECKKPGGRLRPSQQAFLAAVSAAGGLALCVKSVDDLIAALDAEGL